VIIHGEQYRAEERRREATTYYAPTSGIGRTITLLREATPGQPQRVGLIGLGAMGAGMAASLRRAGFAPHVFDIRPGVAQAFVKEGGTACASVAELAAACDVVVSVVVNAQQTEQVLLTYLLANSVDEKISFAGRSAVRKALDDLKAYIETQKKTAAGPQYAGHLALALERMKAPEKARPTIHAPIPPGAPIGCGE
jgi:phosphoglycerate dehydrogenase-like enzyme